MDDYKNYRAPQGAFQVIASEHAGELILACLAALLFLDFLARRYG